MQNNLHNKKFIPESREELLFLGSLHIASRAIHLFAQYPIADFLLNGAKSIDEVAHHFQFNSLPLGKILDLLASFQLLRKEGECFSLTDTGLYLCHSHDRSLRHLLFWDELRWCPLGKLEEVLISGRASFASYYGEEYFEYLSKNPKAQVAFDEHMKAVSDEENTLVAEMLPLDEASSLIDIGGGEGDFLASVLQHHPHVQASLFELPRTVERASQKLRPQYGERISYLQGSFFEMPQANYDVAILKRVIHDWDEAKSIEILRQAKKTIKPGGKIYLIEEILKDEPCPLTQLFDIFLMTVFGGRERRLADYKDLLLKSELVFSEVIDITGCPMSVIVAYRDPKSV